MESRSFKLVWIRESNKSTLLASTDDVENVAFKYYENVPCK